MAARARWTIGAVAATGGVLGVLLLYYTFAMPTSDVRTRIYILLWVAPGQLGGIAFGVLFAVALITVWLAGWRGRAALGAAAAAAAIGLVLLYSRIMGYLVWMHEEDITRIGQYVRTVAAFALVGGSVMWGRTHRSSPAAV